MSEDSNLSSDTLSILNLSEDSTVGNQPHSISSYVVRGIADPSGSGNKTVSFLRVNEAATKWYCFVRRKLGAADWFNVGHNQNVKFWHIYGAGTNVYPRLLGGQVMNEGELYYYVTELSGSTCPGNMASESAAKPPSNSWYIEELQSYQGTSCGADGSHKVWRDGTLLFNKTNLKGRGDGAWDADWNQFNCQHYQTDEGIVAQDSYLYYDDFYVDNTWARVMIGNNSNFSSCTHREIQIPTEWDDGSITITGNRGSFDPCEAYYLFVVDADGNVNTNGFPIRIVTGAGEAPCPPTGLEIK